MGQERQKAGDYYGHTTILALTQNGFYVLTTWSGQGSIASEILNGKRAISKAAAKRLAEYLPGPLELFIRIMASSAKLYKNSTDLASFTAGF